MSMLSRSMSLAASLRVKSVDVESYQSIHQSESSPCVCMSPPIRTKAQDNSLPALGIIDPSGRDAFARMASLVIKGASGVDVEPYSTAMTSGEASAAFPSI